MLKKQDTIFKPRTNELIVLTVDEPKLVYHEALNLASQYDPIPFVIVIKKLKDKFAVYSQRYFLHKAPVVYFSTDEFNDYLDA